MNILKKTDIKTVVLPGCCVHRAIGNNAMLSSNAMSLGWAKFVGEYGPMEPHHHAEDGMVVVDSKNSYIRFGPAKDQLGERIPLEKDMVLQMPAGEWHVFEYDEGGYVEILYFYGQPDNTVPVQIKE